MSGKKNKRLLGVISIFLWAVILTIVLRSYLEKTGYTLPVFWIVILACAAAFLGWWVYMSVREISVENCRRLSCQLIHLKIIQ